jgi:hypothetical protein
MFYGEIIFIAQNFLQENHTHPSIEPYEKMEKILVQRKTQEGKEMIIIS